MQETTPRVRTLEHKTYTSESLVRRVVLTDTSLMDIELNHIEAKNYTRTSIEVTYRYDIDAVAYSCKTQLYSKLFIDLNKAKKALEQIEDMPEWNPSLLTRSGFSLGSVDELCADSDDERGY